MSTRQPATLLGDVRRVMRRRHYSIHTERAYCTWIKRFVRFHHMTSRDELHAGEAKEVSQVLTLMRGTPQLITKLLYGSGLRIMEAVRLRVQDIDYAYKQITVRAGKGRRDRVTTYPASLTALLQQPLERVKLLHEQDLAEGYGEVYLPYALAQKYPGAAREWGWQYVFPSRLRAIDPRSGVVRRHHIDPSVVNKAIKMI